MCFLHFAYQTNRFHQWIAKQADDAVSEIGHRSFVFWSLFRVKHIAQRMLVNCQAVLEILVLSMLQKLRKQFLAEIWQAFLVTQWVWSEGWEEGCHSQSKKSAQKQRRFLCLSCRMECLLSKTTVFFSAELRYAANADMAKMYNDSNDKHSNTSIQLCLSKMTSGVRSIRYQNSNPNLCTRCKVDASDSFFALRHNRKNERVEMKGEFL